MRVGKWTLREVIQGVPIGHPTHPMFVHFPTALYPAALVLGILARVAEEPVYGRAATVVLGMGLAASVFAAVTGLVDWAGMVPGSTKRRAATRHMLTQISAQVLAAGAFVLHLAEDAPPSLLTLVVLGASIVTMIVGNWFGGVLVYRMAMRVSTRPASVPTRAEAA